MMFFYCFNCQTRDLEDQQEQDEVKELPKKEQISLEDIDQKLMSVDDYLKEK